MKNITITLDLKSICVGALSVLAIVSLSNFNKADEHRADSFDEIRRFQVVMGEKGSTIILDTKTGNYLMDYSMTPKPRWLKGDFTATHKNPSTKSD
ncbi:hypothetical protein [Spirosoma lituiforme]